MEIKQYTNFRYGLSVYYKNLQIRNLAKRQLQNRKEEQEKYLEI